jgi:hypothetical protein
MTLSWALRFKVKAMSRKQLLEVNREHRLGVDEHVITNYKLEVARAKVGNEIVRRLGRPRLPGEPEVRPRPPRPSSDINPYDISNEEEQ